jgi:hypothetical protein
LKLDLNPTWFSIIFLYPPDTSYDPPLRESPRKNALSTKHPVINKVIINNLFRNYWLFSKSGKELPSLMCNIQRTKKTHLLGWVLNFQKLKQIYLNYLKFHPSRLSILKHVYDRKYKLYITI